VNLLLDTNACILLLNVTHNTVELGRVRGLRIEDWESTS